MRWRRDADGRAGDGIDLANLRRVAGISALAVTAIQTACAAVALPRGRRDYADSVWGLGLAAVGLTCAVSGTGDRGRRWALAAIVGGWAAMELTKKGLRTLVLERGPMVRHIADYPTANTPPWGAEYPRGQLPLTELNDVYPVQKRTGYAVTEFSKHFFVKDHEDPYTETQRFDWIRPQGHAGPLKRACQQDQ